MTKAEFRKKVLEFYKTHTAEVTARRFGITPRTLFRWQRKIKRSK